MDIAALQTVLFVPADRSERYAKALASGADAVILDLEDAVAPESKEAARAGLAGWLLTQAPASVLVRINAFRTPWFKADMALCQMPAVGGIVVPKVESRDVLEVIALHTGKPLLPIIESAAGLGRLTEVAECQHVARLLFGKLDLAIDLGMDYPAPTNVDPEELAFLFYRSQIVLASRHAALPPPLDGVYTRLNDPDGLLRYAQRSVCMGFGGMLLIHPQQVEPVRTAYMPTDEQVLWAKRVLQAANESAGAAVMLDGAMVDRPVVLRAARILGAHGGV